MPAVIESTLYVSPGGAVVPGSTQLNSRDDLHMGYQVVLHSFQVATTYSWSLSFASDSPGSVGGGTPFDGTPSISALLPPLGSTSRDAKFNVDYEGTYLIRLVVDAGLPTEDTQFIRCRVLTLFGALKLVAAGERRDALGVIPVDATPEGWANDQNANLQRISILLRRSAVSSRVLFVDANRGRDPSATPNDYANVLAIPGPDSAREEETGIKLRAMAHGDFASINEAITYAGDAVARGEPALSKTNPYFIYIRPGFYEEDLNLASFVHLFGDIESSDADVTGLWDDGPKQKAVIIRTVNSGGTGTHTYNPGGTAAVDECFLYNLQLENTADTTNPVLLHQGGLLQLTRCVVSQRGDDAAQGAALDCSVSDALYTPQLWITDSTVHTLATTGTCAALYINAIDSLTVVRGSIIQADSAVAIRTNDSRYANCSIEVRDHSVVVAGQYPYVGYSENQTFDHSEVRCTVAPGIPAILLNAGGNKVGNVNLYLRHTHVHGAVSFSTTHAVGTTQYIASGLTQSGVTGPLGVQWLDAPGVQPTSAIPEMRADSLWYVKGYIDPKKGPAGVVTIPAANQVAIEDVQRALDTLWQGTFPVTGSPFFSLNSSYNGASLLYPYTAGVGLGRNIDAVGGAVQIQGSSWPSPTGLESHLKHGGLQTEGIIDIGGFRNGGAGNTVFDVGGSEIHLNPNQAGVGPFIGLGSVTWPNGVTLPSEGFPGGFIVAGGAQIPTGQNPYHLHLRTADLRTPSTTRIGNIYMVAGATQDVGNYGGDVHIVAGSNHTPAGHVGDLWLVPGGSDTPKSGVVWFVGAPDPAAGALRFALTPAGNFVAGTAGRLYFATPTGIDAFTLLGTEATAAAAAIAINAQTKHIIAKAVGFQVILQSEYGPAGDLYYLGEDAPYNLNLAMGNYILGFGATLTVGQYGNMIAVDVPQDGRLRVNGDLEVTGTIIGGGGISKYAYTAAAAYPLALLSHIEILGVGLQAGVDTVVTLNAGEPQGRTILIKDELGLANNIPGGQKISIVDSGGAGILFDGATPLLITTAYGSVTLYKNNANNWSVT